MFEKKRNHLWITYIIIPIQKGGKFVLRMLGFITLYPGNSLHQSLLRAGISLNGDFIFIG
jgi:hypothetical protein